MTGIGSESRYTDHRPAFLITIDTEGDNLWAKPKAVKTENARFLPRFQELCESKGFKPTYLVDYDMAKSEAFVEFGRGALRNGSTEIGMHLHAWNTPPDYRLTEADHEHCTYLVEYPTPILRKKIHFMTELLAQTFEVAIRSHRAGRWTLNDAYAKALLDHGYWVDCSVTPHISWGTHAGGSNGGGSDYRHFPNREYFVDVNDISKPGTSGLLEVPMSIMPCRFEGLNRIRNYCREGSVVRRTLDRLFPPHTWFRPKRDNLGRMLDMLAWVKRQKLHYVEFMLHSSELMPSGSPSFPTEADIEKLYADLNVLLEAASAASFQGTTLSEYYQSYCEKHVAHCT